MARLHTGTLSRITFLTLLAGLSGCAKDTTAPSPAGSASAAATAQSAAPVATLACKLEPEKVWGDTASALSGVLVTVLDSGRAAAGAVLGGRPVVLVFDGKGEGQKVDPALKKPLTTAPEGKGARREIRRVTPALGSGAEVIAFVDYREIADGRRLVACGPSDSTDELLKFEGKPLVAVDEDQPTRAAGAEVKPGPAASAAKPEEPPKARAPAPALTAAAPAPKAPGAPPPGKPAAPGTKLKVAVRPPSLHGVEAKPLSAAKQNAVAQAAVGGPQPASAGPRTPAPAVSGAAQAKPKGDKQRELRDCRTIADPGGAHVWSVGSELVGQPLEDGSTDYSMNFFVEQEHGRGKVELYRAPLGKEPTKLPVFDLPSAMDLGGGVFGLTARFKGSTVAWLLDASKHARGATRFYGYSPGAAHFAALAPEAVLLAVSDVAGRHVPRAARFATTAAELPSALSDLAFGAADLPASAPWLVSVGGGRFLSFVADDSTRRLVLLPVDASLATAGSEVQVDVNVLEAQTFAIEGGLVAVYLKSLPGGRAQLVSRVARCG